MGLAPVKMVIVDEDIPRGGAQEAEWLGQNNLIYGGLIAVGRARRGQPPGELPRPADPSRIVAIAKGVAQTFAFAGVTAGFRHINWVAGIGILVGGVLGLTALSTGLSRLDQSP